MSRCMTRVALAAAVVLLTGVASLAQQTTAASETKSFEVLAVDGNRLVVSLPEGTRELTVPNDFRFTVNGQQLAVSDLKVGMKGTATITTRTTVTPVTVTEVKSGTVAQRSAAGIIVRTPEGVKSFTQSDVDKRGVRIVRDGKVAQLSDFREGDRISATIITTLPPKVMTEQEVNATLATTPAAARATPPAARTTPPANTGASAASASTAAAPTTLPKTASSWPLVGLTSIVLLTIGFALTIRRRLV